MPIAKVGALPQTAEFVRMKDQRRSCDKQGITMEDLKKQTALRLASQQKRDFEENKYCNKSYRNSRQPMVMQSVPKSQFLFYPRRGYYGSNEANYCSPHNEGIAVPDDKNGVLHPDNHNNVSGYERRPLEPSHYQSVSQTRANPFSNWLTDIRSEGSSVLSSEYDCNISLTSNVDVGSMLSGESSQQPQRFYRLNPVAGPESIRSLQVPVNRESQVSPLQQSSSYSLESKAKVESGSVSSSVAVSEVSNQRGCRQRKFKVPKERQSCKGSNEDSYSPHNHRFQSNRLNVEASPSLMTNDHPRMRQDSGQQRHVLSKPKKFSHSLSVSELKEMTRARLAKEAAENAVSENNSLSDVYLVMQQPKHTSAEFLVSESSSGETQTVSQLKSKQMEIPLTPQSQIFRQSPSSSYCSNQPVVSNRSYMSPLRTTQQSQMLDKLYRQNNQASQYEQMHQQFLQENLETNSNASINSTLGSESIQSSFCFNAGLQPHLIDESYLSSRSWSYPAGVSLGGSATEFIETPKSTSSFFEASGGLGSIGSGRRRLGSSPPGINLEVPHEDRPLHLVDDRTISLFEPVSAKWGVPNSPVQHLRKIDSIPVPNLIPETRSDLVLPPLSSNHTLSNAFSLSNRVAESVLHNSHMSNDDNTQHSFLTSDKNTSSIVPDSDVGKKKWKEDLIGLTNHFGSFFPFSVNEQHRKKPELNTVHGDQPIPFVSRIDPELVQASSIVHNPTSLNVPMQVKHTSSIVDSLEQKPTKYSNQTIKNQRNDTVSSPHSTSSAPSKPKSRYGSSSKKKYNRDKIRKKKGNHARS